MLGALEVAFITRKPHRGLVLGAARDVLEPRSAVKVVHAILYHLSAELQDAVQRPFLKLGARLLDGLCLSQAE